MVPGWSESSMTALYAVAAVVSDLLLPAAMAVAGLHYMWQAHLAPRLSQKAGAAAGGQPPAVALLTSRVRVLVLVRMLVDVLLMAGVTSGALQGHVNGEWTGYSHNACLWSSETIVCMHLGACLC